MQIDLQEDEGVEVQMAPLIDECPTRHKSRLTPHSPPRDATKRVGLPSRCCCTWPLRLRWSSSRRFAKCFWNRRRPAGRRPTRPPV